MLWSALLSAVVLTGCSSEGPSGDASGQFAGVYVDPTHSAGTLRLSLSTDGAFQLVCCEEWGDEHGSSESELGAGEWELVNDHLELTADGWTVVLVPDDVGVVLAGRRDTLPGLSWAASSVQTHMDSARFVRRPEFADFVHPPEGSGSSPGGL